MNSLKRCQTPLSEAGKRAGKNKPSNITSSRKLKSCAHASGAAHFPIQIVSGFQ
jgi:hypothetical protein